MKNIEQFSNWLQIELDKRHWTQADLAKKSNVSASQINRLMSNERGLGEQSVKAIAEALKIPVDQVYRAAGFLPPQQPKNERIDQIQHLANELTDDEQVGLIEYIKFRIGLSKKNEPKKRFGTTQ